MLRGKWELYEEDKWIPHTIKLTVQWHGGKQRLKLSYKHKDGEHMGVAHAE